MNQFYIPEIGDSITLAEDWIFTLYPEHRNEKLANYLGYYQGVWNSCAKYDWIKTSELPRLRNPDYQIVLPDNIYNFRYEQRQEKIQELHLKDPKFVQYEKDRAEYNSKAEQIKISDLQVTIPKDSVLIVDRIYIRKGSSDFSSLSFFWKVDKKSLRFWAKLKDVNKIKTW